MLPKKLSDYTFSPEGKILVLVVNQLIDHLSQNEVKEEWPKNGENYWYLNEDGSTIKSRYKDDIYDTGRKSFLGIFRTQSEAEAARDRIKELLKTI